MVVDRQKKYSTTVLVEEVAFLRKRIKDLELGELESAAEQRAKAKQRQMQKQAADADSQATSLRKELADATAGRAEMEMEYMNMLASLESEKRTSIESLEAKLKERDNTISILQQRSSSSEENALLHQTELDNLRGELDKQTASHKTITDKLERDVALRDSQIEDKNKEVEVVGEALRKIEDKNNLLSEEVSELKNLLDEKSNDHKKEMLGLTLEITKLGKDLSSKNSDAEEKTKELEVIREAVLDGRETNAGLNEEIRRLKRTLEEQSDLVSDLRKEIADLSSDRSELVQMEKDMSSRDPSIGERTKEIEESTVTELEVLRKELEKEASLHKSEIATLQREVAARDAQIEEKSKDNEVMREFLMDRVSQNDSLGEEVTTLKKKLEEDSMLVTELKAEIDELKSDRLLFEEKAAGSCESQFLEHKVQCDTEINALQQENENLGEEVKSLKKRLSEESKLVADMKVELRDVSEAQVSEQKLQYNAEISAIREENECLRAEVSSLEEKRNGEAVLVADLKKEISDLTSERLSYEQVALENYENRASENNNKYEAEIDALRSEISNTSMKKAQMEMDYMNRVAQLETSKVSVIAALEEDLERQKSETAVLQLALNNKDEEVQRTRMEMQQICGSINMTMYSRRDEMDELQAELLEKTETSQSQAREIHLLKMKLEERNRHRDDEVAYLRSKLADDQPKSKGMRAHMNEKQLEKLKDDNEQMRERISVLTEERRTLHEKLNDVVAGRDSSKSVQVLRDRNSMLKREVEKLSKRCKHLEKSITRVAI